MCAPASSPLRLFASALPSLASLAPRQNLACARGLALCSAGKPKSKSTLYSVQRVVNPLGAESRGVTHVKLTGRCAPRCRYGCKYVSTTLQIVKVDDARVQVGNPIPTHV